LEKEVNKDMGRYLEVVSLYPFLNIGFIIECFNLLGKTTKERVLLQTYVKGEMRKRALVFKILIGISS
jgi:hypothetical protein